MAKTMRAGVVHAFGKPLSIEEIPIPTPGPGEVLIKVVATGVCHTDLHAAEGDWPAKPSLPFVPGHEGVGIIAACGSGVSGWQSPASAVSGSSPSNLASRVVRGLHVQDYSRPGKRERHGCSCFCNRADRGAPVSRPSRVLSRLCECGEALRYTPHASFARGEALHNVLQELKQESEHRSEAAQRHMRDFCKRNKIAMLDRPSRSPALSASWRMEAANGEDPFIMRARLHDLVVMGRFTHPNGLPPALLRLVLVGCGRPIMVAATSAPRAFHTLMVAWKDTREAARALTAAMPLLTEARRVVVTAVEEPKASANSAATVANQLAWHGVRAEAQTIKADGRPIAFSLTLAAEACGADLPVMGSYSTGPLRQEIFGGCTRSILNKASIPVFLLH